MAKRKRKLNNHKTKDGDSAKERNRYKELLQLEEHGCIQNLQKQVKYLLIPSQYAEINGKKTCIERSCSYIADFVYQENGNLVVEDVKGYRKGATYALFTIKRKLMLSVYGIKIKEI